MTAQDPAFFTLRDDAALSLATASTRRVPTGKGRADIGGRLRVARILQSIGIQATDSPVRISGSTNEVWRAGDYVIRVGFQTGSHRLRREGVLAGYLHPDVLYPHVVATGVEAFGEWIVVKRRIGSPLSEAWGSMTGDMRRSTVHQLAEILRDVHRTPIDEERDQLFHINDYERELLPHQLPVERILELLEQARYVHGMDRSFIDDVTARVRDVAFAMPDHERFGLVHGDLHFENVLVQNDTITSLLDFEWANRGPREIDLDTLARFCHDPSLHIGGAYRVDPADYYDVLRWMREVYPELFADPHLRERLFLTALSFDVPWLLRIAVDGPASSLPAWHPVNQIRDLLTLGSYAERLGFGD